MALQRKNRELFITKEALATLALAKEGALGKVNRLMDEDEANEVDESGYYKGYPMPFAFIMAPSGKRNQHVIIHSKKGDVIDLKVDGEKRGEIYVEGSHKIDKVKRAQKIFGSYDPYNPDMKKFVDQLGDYAVSGEFSVDFDEVKKTKDMIKSAINEVGAQKVTGIMLEAKPFHRGHERLLRMALEKADLLIVFLLKPYKNDDFTFEIRLKSLQYFIDNYLPRNRALIIPFHDTYLFAGENNLVLDSIATLSYGCNKLVIGQNHSGINIYFDNNQTRSSLDRYKDDIAQEIVILSEFVYCNVCKTLVSTKTCPHGQHHHIKYRSDSLQTLLKAGMLPPAVLMRKDISAYLLSELFPNRFENIQKIYDDLFPNAGLLEAHNERDFYLELMNLYQTTSLI